MNENTPPAAEGESSPVSDRPNTSENVRAVGSKTVEQIDEVRGEIERVRSILGDAVGQMSTSHTDLMSLCQQLSAIADSDASGEIGPVAQRLFQEVSTLSMALQFDDLVQQLCTHLLRRLLLVRTLGESLQSSGRSDEIDLPRLFEELAEVMADRDGLFGNVSHNAVSQEDLSEGEILLF